METLCSREYWKRTWILQEVLAATTLELQCGSQSVSWAAFDHLAQKFRREVYVKDSLTPFRNRIVNISRGPAMRLVNHRSSRVHSNQASDLVSLIERYRLSECTDRRDTIYALLGMASDKPMQRGLIPDYSKDIVALYTEVIHYCKVNASKMLWFAFLLRMRLKIRPRDILDYKKKLAPKTSLIQVKAACLGRVTYVFPSLDILRPDHRPFDSYLDDSDGQSDNDSEDDFHQESMGYVKYAHYVGSENGYVSVIPADEQIQEKSDHQVLLNDISYDPWHFTNSRTKRHADFEHTEYPWPMQIMRTASELRDRERERAQKALLKLAGHRERAQRRTQPNLIEANGRGFQRRAGFACDSVQPGDMICQFIGCDIGLVLRHEHPSYRIVGRVDMMEQNLPERWEDIAMESQNFRPAMLMPETFGTALHVTLTVSAVDLLRFARHDLPSFTVPDMEDCKSWSDHIWNRWTMNIQIALNSIKRYAWKNVHR